MGHQENRPSAKQVVKKLLAEDGWKGFYRGLGPRFFSMSAWGTSMILTYEYLSKKSFFYTQNLTLSDSQNNQDSCFEMLLAPLTRFHFSWFFFQSVCVQ